MKVLKAINNNVVSCLDSDGTELVVMGRGLGFHVRPGEAPNPEKIEKIFRMDSPEETLKLKNLFAELSPELLELCAKIIEYASQVLGRRLNQSVYLTLTDHMAFSMERVRQGMDLPNPLSTEVRVFYPEEYAIGRHALEQVRQQMHMELPGDEAASIALHIVNAEYTGSMSTTIRAAHTLQPVTAILETWPNLKLDKTHLCYDELLVHLKFVAMQNFTEMHSPWEDPALSGTIAAAIPDAFACASAICGYLSGQSGNPIRESEQACLALCIQRACQ